MKEFELESKLYFTPTKKKLLMKILLNAFLVIFSLVVLFTILMDGMSIGKVGELCLGILVVTYFNANNKSGYQFAMLNLTVSNDAIKMIYHNVKNNSQYSNVTVNVQRKELCKIEYSRRLNAVRLVGSICKEFNGKKEIVDDWVIYTNSDSEKLANAIGNNWGINIDMME